MSRESCNHPIRDTDLREAVLDGSRLSASQALALFDLPVSTLGYLGDMRRKRVLPHERVGYIVDRIINYTNRCVAKCSFCAFHAEAGTLPEFDLDVPTILAKIEELVAVGGTQVMLQGGLHPNHDLNWYVDLIRSVKEHFPNIHLHSFSPAEIDHIAGREGMAYSQLIGLMQDAGLDSIPGASDLLVDSVRAQVSPNKCSRDVWATVIRAIADHGMFSSATMTYGMGESLADRVEHLMFVRKIQDETGVFQAFIPWSFSPANTQMCDIVAAGGLTYLKMVAISRIVLDNIVHIQAGWLTEGLELAQLALKMGADDMGGVLTEELVVKAAGGHNQVTVDMLCDLIRNAGKEPVRRDSRYQPCERVGG
jgi:cyclic dehypoxanthinyl futalosine synthase